MNTSSPLLPAGTVLPREREVWESRHECVVRWAASLAGHPRNGTVRLPSGERLRVIGVDDPRPICVHFQPLRYKELEDAIVPAAIRQRPEYTHYWLFVRIARVSFFPDEPPYLHEDFRLVEHAA